MKEKKIESGKKKERYSKPILTKHKKLRNITAGVPSSHK
jgi:hypothetical protein